jgi:hypothetical protein
MSTQESELALDTIDRKKLRTWDETRTRNLGATLEKLIERRGFSLQELVPGKVVEELTQEDLALAA